MAEQDDNKEYEFGSLNDLSEIPLQKKRRPFPGQDNPAGVDGRAHLHRIRDSLNENYYGSNNNIKLGEYRGIVLERKKRKSEDQQDPSIWQSFKAQFFKNVSNNSSQAPTEVVRVRIPELHSLTPDPSQEDNKTKSNLSQKLHPIFIDSTSEDLGKGDIVKVRISKNSGEITREVVEKIRDGKHPVTSNPEDTKSASKANPEVGGRSTIGGYTPVPDEKNFSSPRKDACSLSASDSLLDFIKRFEASHSPKLEPYEDAGDSTSIGYAHLLVRNSTPQELGDSGLRAAIINDKAIPGKPQGSPPRITKGQAQSAFEADVGEHEERLKGHLNCGDGNPSTTPNISQHVYDGLVDFIYQTGAGRTSNPVQLVINKDQLVSDYGRKKWEEFLLRSMLQWVEAELENAFGNSKRQYARWKMMVNADYSVTYSDAEAAHNARRPGFIPGGSYFDLVQKGRVKEGKFAQIIREGEIA